MQYTFGLSCSLVFVEDKEVLPLHKWVYRENIAGKRLSISHLNCYGSTYRRIKTFCSKLRQHTTLSTTWLKMKQYMNPRSTMHRGACWRTSVSFTESIYYKASIYFCLSWSWTYGALTSFQVGRKSVFRPHTGISLCRINEKKKWDKKAATGQEWPIGQSEKALGQGDVHIGRGSVCLLNAKLLGR